MNKKMKNKKQEKRQKKTGEKSRKKRKRGPKGVTYHPRWAHKLIFQKRKIKRNRNEIEVQKKSDFEHPTKKMKENERN